MLDTKNLIKLIIYSPHGKRVISYNINAIIRCYIFFNFILRAVSKIKKVKENLGGRYNLLNNKKYKVRSSDKSNKDRGRENVINFLTLYPNLYLHRILLLYHFLL